MKSLERNKPLSNQWPVMSTISFSFELILKVDQSKYLFEKKIFYNNLSYRLQNVYNINIISPFHSHN